MLSDLVHNSPVSSLVLPVLFWPSLERQDVAASQTLRAALSKVIKYGQFKSSVVNLNEPFYGSRARTASST